MLINLGLGSMIGTMSGITTPIIDTFKVRKEVFTGEVSSPATSLGRAGGPHCLEESLQGSVGIAGGELGCGHAGNGPSGGLGVPQGLC